MTLFLNLVSVRADHPQLISRRPMNSPISAGFDSNSFDPPFGMA